MGLYNISIALFFCLELAIVLMSFKLKNKKILIFVLVIMVSFLYAKLIEYRYDQAFREDEKYYLAKVISLKENSKYYNKYTIQIKSGKYKNNKVLAYTKEELQYGDIIKFDDIIEKPETARNDKRIWLF